MAGRKKSNIFAAVGAATGLGNAFRFPALCVSYGAVFIVAYAAALALVCFPLLCAELDFGRRAFQRADGKGVKIQTAIMRAAAANSALVALYYGVIAAKLGSASLSFAATGGVTAGGKLYIVLPVFLFLTVAVFALLKGGQRALSLSGRFSVVLSLTLFAVLAAFGIARGRVFSSFDISKLLGGAIWVDALGQALLALSLAAGVMPTFARGREEGFSVPKTALAITGANFAGCVLATLATLPHIAVFPSTVGINCALEVYPQVISAVAGGGFKVNLLGFVTFSVLTLVAVQSLCSLALPAVNGLSGALKRGGLTAPLIFCLALALSAPLFAAGGLQPLAACDRMACSVNAVIIALSECLFFASRRHIRGVTGFFVRFFCPLTCGILALFSLCSARFSDFSALARACAYVAAGAVFVAGSGIFKRALRRLAVFIR